MQPVKVCATSPKGSLPERVEEEHSEGNRLTQIHLENGGQTEALVVVVITVSLFM